MTAPTAVSEVADHAPAQVVAETVGTDRLRPQPPPWRGAVAAQLAPLIAQLAAGAGNLAFVLASARLLTPGEFAVLATFVVAYTLLHLPGAGLAAAGACGAERAVGAGRVLARIGCAVGASLALTARPLGELLGIPPPMMVALAMAAPGALLLGLYRGATYGTAQPRVLVKSLLGEALGRLVVGVPLVVVAGPVGGAAALVLAGYAGLAAALRSKPQDAPEPASRAKLDATTAARESPWLTAGAFLGLAVVQQVDLLIANAKLDVSGAAAFAVVSTIGGLVTFGGTTLPLVVLAPSKAPRAHRLGVAVTMAVGLTVVATSAGWLWRDQLVEAVTGSVDSQASGLVAPYLSAMGLLVLSRVIVAHRNGDGRAASSGVSVAVALGCQIVLLFAWARTPGQVVASTVVGAVVLATVVVVGEVIPKLRVAIRSAAAALSRPGVRATALVLGVATLVALATRLLISRGLWVDEAISVRQARLPFGDMLGELAATDVHPPLYYAILWASRRLTGEGELALRLPSVIAGTLTVPAVFGLAREAFDRRTAVVAAVFAVAAPFLVWYSQEARMYGLFILLAVLAAWAQIRALKTGSWTAWVMVAIASAALVATQWFGVTTVVVQQVACAVVVRRRHDVQARAQAQRWAVSAALLALLLLPLVPYLITQLQAYSERGAGLAFPSLTGVDASSKAGGISIYAALANLIWAGWGYHADSMMAQIASLWPLAMLAALALLGRRVSDRTRLLVALVVLPFVAIFLLGLLKRDLFELRYAAGVAPILVVLLARAVSTIGRSQRALLVSSTVVTGALVLGLVDQQLNGANPRLYDFKGAVAAIEGIDPGGRGTIAYGPAYLGDVISYYAPDRTSVPIGALRMPSDTSSPVFVLVSDRLLSDPSSSAQIGTVLSELESSMRIAAKVRRPNVTVWALTGAGP